MLHGSFPEVARRHELDRVVHETWVRLLQALDKTEPASVADFFRLAALRFRQVLLDLAQNERRRAQREVLGLSGAGSAGPAPSAASTSHDPARLGLWTEFHEKVATLSEPERAVFEMHYYSRPKSWSGMQRTANSRTPSEAINTPCITWPLPPTAGCGDVRSVAFSADGKLLAAGSYQGAVKVWDLSPGAAEPLTHHLYAGPVLSLAFSPDGRHLAWCTGTGRVQIIDSRTGEEVQTLRGHDGIVSGVAFSPDGRLATAGSDRRMHVWDAGPSWITPVPDRR
jgi:hypothetical protein